MNEIESIKTINKVKEEIVRDLGKRDIKKEDKVDKILLENESDLYNQWGLQQNAQNFFQPFQKKINYPIHKYIKITNKLFYNQLLIDKV